MSAYAVQIHWNEKHKLLFYFSDNHNRLITLMLDRVNLLTSIFLSLSTSYHVVRSLQTSN